MGKDIDDIRKNINTEYDQVNNVHYFFSLIRESSIARHVAVKQKHFHIVHDIEDGIKRDDKGIACVIAFN